MRIVSNTAPTGRKPSLAKQIVAWLEGNGFTGSASTEESKRRYTQRTRGTDDWNAHRTNVTTLTVAFKMKDKGGEGYKKTVAYLSSVGVKLDEEHTYKPYNSKGYKTTMRGFSKGRIWGRVATTNHVTPQTSVSFTFETTKPDLEFERSGRGRGQII